MTAQGFQNVAAHGEDGGFDKAYVKGVKSLDTVFGSGGWFRHSRSDGRTNEIRGFDAIEATAEAGHTPTDDTAVIDYVFEKVGTWN